ncbi:MAG: amidophosphoribosyltransferase [Deltaproteobacteria bacterium]|nr:amidophosphoribosyltransferase [Deltaproteobacteria bacterium]
MCGIVGIYNHPEAANMAYLCLCAEQHRGQESAGIASVDDKKRFHHHKAMGLALDIFDARVIASLPGRKAVGHVRYSTTGSSSLENAQPFLVREGQGGLVVAHNGNLTNALEIRHQLEASGAIFQSTMDTEVIMHLIARERSGVLADRILAALKQVQGAYSLVFLSDEVMVAARDPKGFRPLVIGRVDEAYVVVSETCALDLIDATFVREVLPGELIVFDQDGMHSHMMQPTEVHKAYCIFEYIYFARPDSHIFGRDVYPIRQGFGKQLALEHPVEADVVIPVPDSGVPAAIGYAQQSGIPYQMGLIRNHYVGRTFIEPKSEIRHFGVKVKLNPVQDVLKGKRVVVVDDSIVRGTTSMKIVKMIRAAGAKEVHVRISSPPIKWPCFYGIDIPTREELIAAHQSVEEIRGFLTADSLGYLSHERLYWFEKLEPREWYCDACFTGKYPIPLTDAPEIMKESGCGACKKD